jgi:hypothetical protein
LPELTGRQYAAGDLSSRCCSPACSFVSLPSRLHAKTFSMANRSNIGLKLKYDTEVSLKLHDPKQPAYSQAAQEVRVLRFDESGKKIVTALQSECHE